MIGEKLEYHPLNASNRFDDFGERLVDPRKSWESDKYKG